MIQAALATKDQNMKAEVLRFLKRGNTKFSRVHPSVLPGPVHWLLASIASKKPLKTFCPQSEKYLASAILHHAPDASFRGLSRQTMTRYIPSLAKIWRLFIKDLLKNVEAISIAADGWEALTRTHFLGVTCHFIDYKWKLCVLTLAIQAVEVAQTADNIASAVEEIIDQFTSEKTLLASLTCDGAAAMVKAANKTVGGSDFSWCFCHLLSLAAFGAVEDDPKVRKMVEVVREISKFFRRFLPSTHLKKAQEEKDKGKIPLVPTLDVPTRWNSVFAMLQKFVRLFPFLGAIWNEHVYHAIGERYSLNCSFQNLRICVFFVSHFFLSFFSFSSFTKPCLQRPRKLFPFLLFSSFMSLERDCWGSVCPSRA